MTNEYIKLYPLCSDNFDAFHKIFKTHGDFRYEIKCLDAYHWIKKLDLYVENPWTFSSNYLKYEEFKIKKGHEVHYFDKQIEWFGILQILCPHGLQK